MNGSGRQRALFGAGTTNLTALSTVSASAAINGKPLGVNEVGTGSESSLVRDVEEGGRTGDGIRKTVSVSLRSHRYEETGEKKGERDVERGKETSWFGK